MSTCKSLMLGAMLLCATAGASAAQTFPAAPVRIVVSTPPGGASDTSARVIAEGLSSLWKQPVVVENKTGASGTIGAAAVARAPADGYTVFFGTGSTHVVAPLMLPDTPYDPERDFTPLAIVGYAPFVLFARSDLPANTLQELVAYAKAQKSDLNFGTSGPATIYEVAALLLEREGKLKLNHIPYKGLAPMAMDVAAGRVDLGVGPIDGYLKNDKLKVLAVLGNERVASLPNVPSSAEAGYPGFAVPVWAAIWGPPGLPAPVAAALEHGLLQVLGESQVQGKIAATGVFVQAADGRALRGLVRRDLTALKEFGASQARAAR
ncbi:MAG: Bug family tripartite tricarboxylate transporter substrate binding protein [Achromobacter veterisilvae]